MQETLIPGWLNSWVRIFLLFFLQHANPSSSLRTFSTPMPKDIIRIKNSRAAPQGAVVARMRICILTTRHRIGTIYDLPWRTKGETKVTIARWVAKGLRWSGRSEPDRFAPFATGGCCLLTIRASGFALSAPRVD